MQAPSLLQQAQQFEQKQQHKEALVVYAKLLELEPTNAQHYNAVAVIQYKLQQFKTARLAFEKAIQVNPNYAEAYANLGALHAKFKNYEMAIKLYQKAIELKPSYAGSYTNLGNALNKIHEYEQSVYFHLRAIALDPKAANHYANIGSTYKNLGRFDKAKQMYKKALSINKNHVNAHFDLATVLLQTHAFEWGFKEYEWRVRKEEMQGHIQKFKEIFTKPLYRGENLEGKTILVHAEQGFGDSLMVARYFKVLKEQGAKVIVHTRPPLVSLFSRLAEVDTVLDREKDTLPSFDYQLPIMSLPLVCDSHLKKITKNYPYLKVATKQKKKKSKKLRVGIVWGASNTGESYAKKVMDLRHFDALLKHKNVEVHSLQIGEDEVQIKSYGYESKLINRSGDIKDFTDTAKIMQELDLVISVDTAVAHLAGAMGLNVWVLLQKVPDWRWGVDGEKSIWYPSATLIRQYSLGDWNSVFKRMHTKLQTDYKLSLQ